MGNRSGQNWAANVALSIGALIACTGLLEAVGFRFILLPSDVPEIVFEDGVLSYRPGQQGVWRVRDEIAARFRINAQGWNSPHASYQGLDDSARRVVIVGDSYVAAFEVDFDQSFAEAIERELDDTVALRLGVAGAPLSQYLLMYEERALRLHPDAVVFNLVHNDFVESYAAVPGRYTASFLRVRPGPDGAFHDLYPAPYSGHWYDPLRRSATFRYLYYRQRIGLGLRALMARGDGRTARANVYIEEMLSERERMEALVGHVFGRLAALGRASNAPVLVVLDADRASLYEGTESALGFVTEIVRDAAESAGFEFLDLTPVFARHYSQHTQRFEFRNDGHWNALGHEVVGRAVAARLRLVINEKGPAVERTAGQ